MEPIPETVEALRELTRLGDESIARALLRISRDVQRIVPEIVGLSLSLINDDLTFTMTATNGPVAQLDGMQYLGGGPCDETLRTGEAHAFEADDLDDELRWQLFAQATSAAGVGSTLSIPILDDGRVVAGINLYASTVEAFRGHHQELSEVCGGWPADVVSNADLGFTTRFEAAKAPHRLRDRNLIDQAVGMLTAQWWIGPEEARRRLSQAAERAGISDTQMAQGVIGLASHEPREDRSDDPTERPNP